MSRNDKERLSSQSLPSRKLVDMRALAGAIALVLVGLQLSVMNGVYFFPGGDALRLLQARWWWEISFNLQILCMVLMWICHHERVTDATGWKKWRAIWRMLVGLAGVSVPSWVLVIGVSNDWFNNPPDILDIGYYAAVVFICWFLMAYLLPIIFSLALRRQDFIYFKAGISSGDGWISLMPFLVLGFVALIEFPRGSNLPIVVWPFLTYLHGAIPYFYRAYGKNLQQRR